MLNSFSLEANFCPRDNFETGHILGFVVFHLEHVRQRVTLYFVGVISLGVC